MGHWAKRGLRGCWQELDGGANRENGGGQNKKESATATGKGETLGLTDTCGKRPNLQGGAKSSKRVVRDRIPAFKRKGTSTLLP